MGKSRKDYEKFLNSISPDRDDETWIIGGIIKIVISQSLIVIVMIILFSVIE